MILIDYACSDCAHTHEMWTPSPPASVSECPQCGGLASRRFAAVGLSGRAATSPTRQERRGPKPAALCTKYPQVPGLCHMSEDAGRMWVARYRGDHRAVDAELARQESRAKDKKPTMADAITHHHYPSDVAAPATDAQRPKGQK